LISKKFIGAPDFSKKEIDF